MPEAFYLPTDDPELFESTPHTIGPWSDASQHAGPPSALLTRAVERLPSSIPGPSQIARLTMDILGPVPVGPLRVNATVTRPGKAVELVEASLSSGDRVAVRTRAWRIRTAELDLPGFPEAVPPPLPADESTGYTGRDRGYLAAVAFHYVTGGFDEPGPASVWTRLRVAVVAGELPSATQRLMAVADSGNGISSLLSFKKWWFINTDLSVHLHRIPQGDWIHMAAVSTLDRSGVGLAETELFDASGRVGRGAQALMVGPRPL